MYVCLCVGATDQMISEAVAAGACTSKEVAAACGAGGDCGRCRCTVRGIIKTALSSAPLTAPAASLRHLMLEITPVGAH